MLVGMRAVGLLPCLSTPAVGHFCSLGGTNCLTRLDVSMLALRTAATAEVGGKQEAAPAEEAAQSQILIGHLASYQVRRQGFCACVGSQPLLCN